MTFYWPHLLWLLLPIVALAVADAVRRGARDAARSRPKILQAWAGARHAEVGSGRHSTRGRLLLWLGLAFGIVALARPQWGRVEEPVFDQARDIIIALDLSRSMEATDVRPSRLERARLLIQGLLDGLKGERVGLVVFSGTAFLQVPLSADYEVLNEFLPSLNPKFMPVGGTNYGAMLRTALDAFNTGNAADRYLIVLSDGEALDPDWRDLLPELPTRNIRVIGLGVGTPQGALIPDGAGGYVKDARGAVVISKLNSSTLQELAKATNGVYTDASSWVDLGALLQKTIETGRKGQFVERRDVRQIERFQWALAPALLCLLFSFWREFPVRTRVRSLPLAAPAARKSPTPNSKSQISTAAAVVVLAVLAGLRYPVAGRAAEDTTAYAAPLSKLVEQLSAQPALSANDYASLARETITWGQRLQGAQQPVMAGPVHDALAGVGAGEKLDPKAADWPSLRSDLDQLLQEPPKPPPQPQQQSQQNQQQKDQRDQQPAQNQDSRNQPQSTPQHQPPPKSQPAPRPPPDQSREPQTEPPPRSPQPQKPEKANTGDTQRIGGQLPPQDQPANPSLALPMQKLDQLRNQDSPAELFQMMDNREHKPQPRPGPDW